MIKLIVGLGNPGDQYAKTRHNAGAWLVERLAQEANISLKPESKHVGLLGKIILAGQEVLLLIPTTFMNRSGQSVSSVMHYYKIKPEEVLVAHDEIDFAPGQVKLKKGGGHGGHNGLRDIIKAIGTPEFYRVRIGVGHPGNAKDVADYVLHEPSKHDCSLIDENIDDVCRVMDWILANQIDKAMLHLHTQSN